MIHFFFFQLKLLIKVVIYFGIRIKYSRSKDPKEVGLCVKKS